MVDVYISSTFQDLQEARAQVRQTVRRMQHVDVAMEYYGASDERPLDKCVADVAACDLYICVVAWRYGFVPEGRTESITELEYRQAVVSGKPRLVFLLDQEARWPMSRMELGAMADLTRFRAELERDTIVDTFTDEADLGRKVAEAIHRWERKQGSSEGVADWESYRRSVSDAHRWVRLAVIAGAKQDRRLTEIPLTDVFVPQQVQGGSPEYEVLPSEDLGARQADAERAEPALTGVTGVGGAAVEQIRDVLARERRQVFLGAPGSGKSTLLLDAVLQLCDTGRGPDDLPPNLRHAPLPFFVELRQYVLDPAPTFVEYIAANVSRRYGLDVDVETVKAVLGETDRAVVMFDGLDEVFDPRTQSAVIEEFRQFSRAYEGCRIVVTSRIAGYEALELERDGFRHYTVLGFGLPEIRDFVPKWYTYYTWQGDERDAQGLIHRISESPRLLDLAGNPLLLTMMAVIYKHHDLPEKRLQLYKRCSEVLLEDWEVKRKKISRQESLPLGFPMVAEQKEELLQQVAMHMLEHREADSELNIITREPLLVIIAEYLQSEYTKSPGEARAVASEILNHLRERTYVIAEVGENRFGFVHRTFMEYFAAQYCKAEFNRREADYDWLTALFARSYWISDWREVLLLLIATLKEQESPVRKVIDHLLSRSVAGVPTHLGFAARCVAEVGASDDDWSRDLLHRLVVAIRSVARANDDTSVAFLNDALTSFSAIMTSPVTLREDTLSIIDGFGMVKALRSRMVGFQLQLALRSRVERREFAINALGDDEEAVRRGAVAALEREWAGREDVGWALTEVLRADRQPRVRMAALEALERGWPGDREVLDAIGRRSSVETAYSVVIDTLRYLSRQWHGDRQALEIVLQFCSTQSQLSVPLNEPYAVRDALTLTLVKGWRHMPESDALLRQHWLGAVNGLAQTGAPALIALARGWADDPVVMDWVREQIAECLDSGAWVWVLAAMLELLPEEGELRARARKQAEDLSTAPQLRMEIVAALGTSGLDAAELAWLELRIEADSSPAARLWMLNVWADVERDVERRVLLLRRTLRSSHTDISLRAFELLLATSHEEGLQAARYLSEREQNRNVRMEVLLMAVLRSPTWLNEFLRERISRDEDQYVRATAVWRLRLPLDFQTPDVFRYLSGFQEEFRIPFDLRTLEFPYGFWEGSRRGVAGIPTNMESGHDLAGEFAFLTDVARYDSSTNVRASAVLALSLLAPHSRAARTTLVQCSRGELVVRLRRFIELLLPSELP
ncbi:DUF4062 domain-containing protein [Streptomyces sp. NPDC051913]|uniref:DUF4062 domain-containing protein n=1 Tax=Streptomyces sp. NPDC051913 TaxID=3365676 RepID=UPI0037D93CC7